MKTRPARGVKGCNLFPPERCFWGQFVPLLLLSQLLLVSPNLYLGDAAPSRARARFNASSSTSNVRPTAPSILLLLWTHESAIISVCLWGCFVSMAFLLLNHLWNSSRSSFPSPLSSNLFIILFTWAIHVELFTPCPWKKNTFHELHIGSDFACEC